MRRQKRIRPYLLGMGLLIVLLAAVGCSQGAYPLDIFYEMHYSPSYKAGEPPRLSVPEAAVPWFPAPKATSFTDDGAHLFLVNCSMCHGLTGHGDGMVLQRMTNIYGYTPAMDPNLTSVPAKALGVNGVKGLLASGVVVMPNFSKMLNEDERNLIAEYVVNCIQGANPQACP